MHNRKHLGIKKNVCNFCDKDFARPSSLRAHIRVHTGERPYSCIYCNKDFTDRGTLRKHTKTHQASLGNDINHENKIECKRKNSDMII